MSYSCSFITLLYFHTFYNTLWNVSLQYKSTCPNIYSVTFLYRFHAFFCVPPPTGSCYSPCHLLSSVFAKTRSCKKEIRTEKVAARVCNLMSPLGLHDRIRHCCRSYYDCWDAFKKIYGITRNRAYKSRWITHWVCYVFVYRKVDTFGNTHNISSDAEAALDIIM